VGPAESPAVSHIESYSGSNQQPDVPKTDSAGAPIAVRSGVQ
jgi:hypothetical protein